ncbi:PKD domain-containing protein [Massilia sp. SYSU DXS3249]
MQTITEAGPTRGGRWGSLAIGPLVALAVIAALPAVQASAGTGPAPGVYNVIPLSDDPLAFGVDINRKGQVAFTEFFPQPEPGVDRGRFFDGYKIHTLGTLGGNNTRTSAVNDLGQVTGFSDTNIFVTPGGLVYSHAFRWSKEKGLVDLTPGREFFSFGSDINNKGAVAGIARGNAALWSPNNTLFEFGPPFGDASFATALNDSGTLVGWSQAGPGFLPSRWTRATGRLPIPGLLESPTAQASDINNAGYIVGRAPFRLENPGDAFGVDHAFLWTPTAGTIDLGTGSGTASSADRINERGTVIGQVTGPGFRRGFVWTHGSGLIEIGRLDGANSIAFDLNNLGQVVGSIGGAITGGNVGERAFVWTRASGAIDLNTRVRNVPHGLVLRRAVAISDNGSIVANTNTGLVLLTTQAASNLRPLVGPIKITGKLRAPATLTFTAFFTDADPHDRHTATWDFGEGSTQAGTVNEKNGSGSVTGQHTYQNEGEFTITLTVTDSRGKRTTIRLGIDVLPAGPCTCGRGTFTSPPGASGASGVLATQPGLATFAFSSSAGKGSVRFDTGGLHLRSTQATPEGRNGQVRYRGSGILNGARGYQFLLTATRSPDGTDRVGVRIWHRDPRSGANVVDYDNMRNRVGADAAGSIVEEDGVSAGAE